MGKLLFVVLLFGAAVYAFFWFLERRRHRPASMRPTPGPRRVVAPDDDEDFLRELDLRRRRAARESKPDKPSPRKPERPAASDESKHEPKPEGPADKGRPKPE